VSEELDSRLAETATYIPGGPPWLALNKAAGSWVYDVDNARYLDFGPGAIVASLGHLYASPSYGIREQMGHYLSAAPVGEVAAVCPARYARTLSEKFSDFDPPRQVLVCSGVTEARRVARIIGTRQGIAPAEIRPISASSVMAHDAVRDMVGRSHDRGQLVIADETVTGFGRTGTFLGMDHYAGVIPDIVLLGPAGGGGLPFAAVVASPECFTHLDEIELGSFSPIVAAAAYGVLVSMTPILMEHVVTHARILTDALSELRDQFPLLISSSTGVGLLQQMHLFDHNHVVPFRMRCRSKGLLLAPDLVMTPPLTVSGDEIAAAADVMADALLEMQEEL
jgi:4-aminobutyrate aminotransferase-like enzyme